MSKILIEELLDQKQPELPDDPSWGFYASGARIYVDNKVAIELIPVAARDGGKHYRDHDIYGALFAHLNIPVVEDDMKTVVPSKSNPAVTIQWLSDSFDCECCGGSWAKGASVSIGGKHAFTLEPIAYCFGGSHYTEEQVFAAIITHFGHQMLPEQVERGE